MSWFPLCVRTTYNFTRGLAKLDAIAPRLAGLGYSGCAVTDHGNLAAVPALGRDLAKAKLQFVAGLCLLVTEEGKPPARVYLYAKDQAGWKRLIKAISLANEPATYKGYPSLTLDQLRGYSEGLVAISGHSWTTLAYSLFERPETAFLAASEEDAKTCLHKDWPARLLAEIERHRSVFGADLYLGTQLMDAEVFPASRLLAEAMRWAAKKTGLRTVAVADAAYLKPEDAADHRLLLCVELKATLANAKQAAEKCADQSIQAFFRCSRYYVPTLEEMRRLHPEGELAAAVDIAASCVAPQTDGQPLMPVFPTPDGSSQEEYFKTLCREGWQAKIAPVLNKLPAKDRAEKKAVYAARIKEEIDTVIGAGIHPQMLVVWDYVRYARTFSITGPGRGSVGGSLAAYLLDITKADPIRYGLMFSRFYNRGRNSPGKPASMADIDMDFQVGARERIVAYIRDKYGPLNVCQMGTFNKLKGRSALQAVLKAHARFSQEELFQITKVVPDPASITDDLQEMMEESEDAADATTIRWVLENEPDALREWVYLDEDKQLQGDLAGDFAQAMRLEGCVTHMGKHAAGVVISPIPVRDVVPLCYDKGDGALVAAWDMGECERAGIQKYDILGLASLEKLSLFEQIVRTGTYQLGV